MRTLHGNTGFSLIELLTVIAIIAVLAAIIFPTMASVKERARTTQCMTQMHDIAMGLSQYKLDNRRYPETLAGYVQTNSEGGVIPFDQSRGDGLYPEYIKSVNTFHCPLGPTVPMDAVVDVTVGGQHFYYYAFDNYDIQSLDSTAGIDALRYTLIWAGAPGDVSGLNPYPPGASDSVDLQSADFKRQLKFRRPSDDTVVTWCEFHARGKPRAMIPVLFLDGHTDVIPLFQVQESRWRVSPKRG